MTCKPIDEYEDQELIYEDQELIEEMDNRGYDCVSQYRGIKLKDLYELKRLNKPEFNRAFADYCYQKIGRII